MGNRKDEEKYKIPSTSFVSNDSLILQDIGYRGSIKLELMCSRMIGFVGKFTICYSRSVLCHHLLRKWHQWLFQLCSIPCPKELPENNLKIMDMPIRENVKSKIWSQIKLQKYIVHIDAIDEEIYSVITWQHCTTYLLHCHWKQRLSIPILQTKEQLQTLSMISSSDL